MSRCCAACCSLCFIRLNGSLMSSCRLLLLKGGLLFKLLSGLEGIDLRLIGVFLDKLVCLAGTVFKNCNILQIINVNLGDNKVYA